MKKSIKTFAYAAAASMMLLACNTADDSELSPQAAGDDLSKATSLSPPEMECTDDIPITSCYPVTEPSDKPEPSKPTEICTDEIPGKCYPVNDPSANKPPYDPSVPIIAKDVEEWMKGQLASKSGEKRLIRISDMHRPEEAGVKFGLSASINSAGEAKYFLNDKEISVEEYKSKLAEYEKQGTNKGKRDLSIPGEIISSDLYGWNVLMTAEQLVELSKKYGELAIGFYLEAEND